MVECMLIGKEGEVLQMKQTENYEQLLERFTKRTEQLEGKQFQLADSHEQWVTIDNQLHYLRGCKETIEYLMTGKLPNDGNHDGMRHHRPVSLRHGNLDSLD